MKIFRTTFNFNHNLKNYKQINLHSPVLLLGSCFSDNIGNLLIQYKFNALSNPFGTIFNPISIFKILFQITGNKEIDLDNFTVHQEIWHHYDYHSSIYADSKNKLILKIQEKIQNARQYLKDNYTIIITFGTAWVYQYVKNESYVANCHKSPSNLFCKKLLTTNQIVEEFEKIYNVLPKNIQIILTVSPVRHIKDTLPLNTVSKSVLRLACHEITEKFSQNVFYFPSYELLMDDLRDYRFYAEDMIHPNEIAIEYIWEIFIENMVSQEAKNFVLKWKKIINSLQHKPLYSKNSLEYQLFLTQLLDKLLLIKEVNVQKEIEEIKSKIIKKPF